MLLRITEKAAKQILVSANSSAMQNLALRIAGLRVADGSIETVITVVPDLYGRLVGKRILGNFLEG